jgi:hypothetical protein
MKHYGLVSICIASVLTVGLAIVCHEAAHILAGLLAGGTPTLWTPTEVRGDFTSLSPAGFVALGVSGSVVNVVLGALGWWMLQQSSKTGERQLLAWFLFAVNGMLVTTKMMGEPIAGFGDWMTVLRPLPATTALRLVVAVLGFAGVAVMVRRTGPALAALVPPGEARERVAEARRILVVGAVASTILVLGSCVMSPIATTRATLLALGAGLGPFIPMLFGLRFVRRVPSSLTAPLERGGWLWPVAAGATVIAIWFVIGPGIPLPV